MKVIYEVSKLARKNLHLIRNAEERIEKLESYMKMEDKITASDILIRLAKIEEKINK